MCHFKADSLDLHGILSIADQRAFVTAEAVEVENVAPSGGGEIHEEPKEIVESDVVVEDDDEDWDLVVIMTGEEVKASRLRGRMRALPEKYCLASIEAAAAILTVVAFSKQSLDLKRQVTKKEQALVDMEQKVQVANSGAMSAQHRALAKVEKARRRREMLEYAGG